MIHGDVHVDVIVHPHGFDLHRHRGDGAVVLIQEAINVGARENINALERPLLFDVKRLIVVGYGDPAKRTLKQLVGFQPKGIGFGFLVFMFIEHPFNRKGSHLFECVFNEVVPEHFNRQTRIVEFV